MFSKQQYELLLLLKGYVSSSNAEGPVTFVHYFLCCKTYSSNCINFFLPNSGPTYIMVLSREDAVQGWRQVIGPTDPEKAKEENPDSCVFLNYLFSLKSIYP